MQWKGEIGIKVINGDGFIQRNINVYYYDPSYKTYIPMERTYQSGLDNLDGYNALFNIRGISGEDSRALDTFDCYGNVTDYIIKINNQFIRIAITCGVGPDYHITYFESSYGVGSFTVTQGNSPTAQGNWTNFKITLKNEMGNDYENESVSGMIKLNEEYVSASYTGADRYREASTFQETHTISGIDLQNVGNVIRKWRRWKDDNQENISRNLGAANDYTYTAKYARQYTANVTTNVLGGGKVYFNSTQCNCPISNSYIYDDMDYSITALRQEYDHIDYLFDHWEKNGSYYDNQSTLTINNPSSSVTFAAIYQAQAIPPSITFGSTIGQPITFTWTDNPNTNVTQYRVWRRVCNNGVWTDDQLIGTVNSGVQTFTDNEYNLGVWKVDQLLEYGLTAFYSVNSSWSSGGANTRIYCTPGASMHYNDLAEGIMIEKKTPSNYSIGSFPNPFNPTTTINYQLPKDGIVTIKVYDIIGKEVATLVNGHKSAGYYKVDFDASKLTSGVYIAAIQASGFNKSIKLLLTK